MVKEKIECSSKNKGNAGEYYIAGLLSIRNCVVSTLGRNIGYDLICVLPSEKAVKIQVKTTTIKRFIFNEKDEEIKNDLFFAFVRFNTFENVDYWIVPSKDLSEYSKPRYERQMKIGYKPGTIRNFTIKKDKFDYDGWEKKIDFYYKNMDLILKYYQGI